jgi:vanillate O-demethylase monooxygenase subunit
MQTYPLNAWYVAAWDHEIGRKLLARQICGKPVVLYRCGDGRAVALEDACWHRMLPLSMGKLQGDKVECGYHGLVYDPAGRCTHIPFQDRIPPSACVRAYPLVERNRFLWIWMGDPGLADPAKIPNLYWNDDPAWVGEPRLLHQQFDYRLVLDNLMDLTHETYVHGSTIGNRAVVEAPFETAHTEDTVTVSRWMLDVEAPPMWAAALGKPGRVDRWQIIKFQAPCIVMIDVGVALAGTGAPQGDRSQGITGYVVNTVTPETERTHYSFHLFTRNYRIRDQRLTRQLSDTDFAILMEDKAVLEAQQRASEEHAGRRFVNLSIDAGAVQVRRILERMVADERQAVPA